MVDVGMLNAGYLFAGAGDDLVKPVFDIAHVVRFAAGETIFREQEEASHLYILQAGLVTLSMSFLHEGKTLHVNLKKVQPGDLFGWSAVTTARRLSAQARAESDSEVIQLPGDRLRVLMDADPRLGYHVMSRLTDLASSRLRDTREQVRMLLGW